MVTDHATDTGGSGAVRDLNRVILSRLAWAVFFAAYAVFLNWIYMNVIQPDFYYQLKQDPTVPFVPFATVLVFLTSFASPVRFSKPSDLILFLVFAVHIAPVLVVLPHYKLPLLYSLVVCIAFVMITGIANAKPIRIGRINGGQTAYLTFAAICVLITTAHAFMSGGLSLGSFSLLDVYQYRTVSLDQDAGTIAYLYFWTYNFFIMMFCMLFVLRRQYFVAAGFVVLQIVMFLATHEKLTLFAPLFVLLPYLAFERRVRPVHLMAGIVVLIAASATLTLHYKNDLVDTILVRRIFFAPAGLTALYKQVFDVYGLQYWGSFLAKFGGGHSGGLPPAMIVGAVISNSAGALENADAGFIGSGYMNAGYAGVLFYALLLGLLLFLVNSLTKDRLPTSFATAMIFFSLWAALNDSDLPVSFVTHGIAVAMLGLWFLGAETPSAAAADADHGVTGSVGSA